MHDHKACDYRLTSSSAGETYVLRKKSVFRYLRFKKFSCVFEIIFCKTLLSVIYRRYRQYASVGFVAAAVSMPMSGCRARRCLAVVDVVSVTVGPAVL